MKSLLALASVEYEDEESVRPLRGGRGPVDRDSRATGEPRGLRRSRLDGRGAHSPPAVAAVMDDTDVFAKDQFFALLAALGVPWFTDR